ENATFWLRQDDSPRNWLWDVAWVGGTYLAVGDMATVLSSRSGTSWTLEAVPEAADGEVLYGVGGSAEVGLAVGSGGLILRSAAAYTNVVTAHEITVGSVTKTVSTTNRIALLGVLWESVEPRPTTNTLQGVAWEGGRFVLTGGEGEILTGTNGTQWTRAVAAGKEFLSSVAGFGGTWVATGAKGAIYTSTDALSWSRRVSGTDRWVYRVARAGDLWVAVGEGGMILTSPDGVSWTPRTSGTTSWLTGVASVGGLVYACGAQGTVLRSADGTAWEPVPTLTGKALYGIASRGAQCIVAGAEGVILRALSDSVPTPVGISGYVQFREPATVLEALTFQGLPEQPFLWQSATDWGAWGPEEVLTLDMNGEIARGREARSSRRFHRAAPVP
ncbi:MAG: hypothetical protein JNL97_17570, partial [Verrucomicrobiales bacterium]|nr:hypothetical protein [Verrucomicrobiales bacterium]